MGWQLYNPPPYLRTGSGGRNSWSSAKIAQGQASQDRPEMRATRPCAGRLRKNIILFSEQLQKELLKVIGNSDCLVNLREHRTQVESDFTNLRTGTRNSHLGSAENHSQPSQPSQLTYFQLPAAGRFDSKRSRGGQEKAPPPGGGEPAHESAIGYRLPAPIPFPCFPSVG